MFAAILVATVIVYGSDGKVDGSIPIQYNLHVDASLGKLFQLGKVKEMDWVAFASNVWLLVKMTVCKVVIKLENTILYH